jgi:lysophospholipase L1-like esterase
MAPAIKSILAFGDSLTWGYDPADFGVRHGPEYRWPTVLEAGLHGQARVQEEGLSGRTTCHDSGFLQNHNGLTALPMILQSHMPLDLVIIMLGTNDLQDHIGASAFNAARGVQRLIHGVRSTFSEQRIMRYPTLTDPQILIISPPQMIHSETVIRRYFGENSREIADMRSEYEKVANLTGVEILHAADYCQPSEDDGVHLNGPETAKLGKALIPVVQHMLDLNQSAGDPHHG